MALRTVVYEGREFPISYEIAGEGPDILFLHGWGSDKEVMKSAFGRMEGFRKIFIDMPGFGKSPNEAILTTKDYAKIVELFLQSIGAKKEIVVGHSFGGKVATLLEPRLLVLLSSAGIVEKKPLGIRAKIALFKLLKPLGGSKIRELFVSKDAKGMSQNMYETFKNVVDEDFEPVFADYGKEALLFWGRQDRVTSLESGRKIAALLDAPIFELEGDHYFFLHHKDFIAEKIRETYEKL